MYRTKVNNLSLAQVQKLVAGVTPAVAKGESEDLTGSVFELVLDDEPIKAPRLCYEITGKDSLLYSEDGKEAVSCKCAVLTLKDMILFTHAVPDAMKAYVVMLSSRTGIATVYELWYIDYEGKDLTDSGMEVFKCADIDPFINREVQRQVYHGYYVQEGRPAPEKRNEVTLRLDNRMILWDDDLGRRELVTYTTFLFCTIVEPDAPDGGDVLTLPSDVFKISDSLFIHAHCGVEYTGREVVEIIDIMNNKKIGVIYGIDENDRAQFTAYRGSGRMIGQLAKFYDFNDKGNELSPLVRNRMSLGKKGARATYRTSVLSHKLDAELLKEYAQVRHILESMTNPDPQKQMMSSTEILDESDLCVGREITLKFDDGTCWEYRFPEIHTLEYKAPEETEWHRELYKPFELDENLVCLGHFCSDAYPPACHILFLDFDYGLATGIEACVNGKYDLRDAVPQFHFGIMETEGVTVYRLKRHGFTKELLGKSFTWTYSDNMTSQHIYNAPHSYSWTIINNTGAGTPMNRAGGYVWSSPCEYIKLRDDVYVMNWVEERWEGIMGCVAMNLRLMHDCGFSFGMSTDGESVHLEIMGALARNAGSVDLSGVYDI